MKALVFDTETTDLLGNSLLAEQHKPRVIEFFGHVVTEYGEVLAEADFLLDPGIALDPKITKITGIRPEDLVGKDFWVDRADEVEDLIGLADTVVAHNLSFDMAVVDGEFARYGHAVKWPERRICTVEATEWMKGHRLNLSRLHEELFGEKFAGAHRARHDVEALTRCFLELVRRGDV